MVEMNVWLKESSAKRSSRLDFPTAAKKGSSTRLRQQGREEEEKRHKDS